MTAGAEIANLHKSYGLRGRAVPVLTGLDFVQRDGITVVLGPSGCGKTTLLRIVAGMEAPDDGVVRVRGDGRTGMVFQEPRLMPWLSAAQNVAFGQRRRRCESAGLLALVGLAGFEDALPHQLSGGMRHRVALARALANGPSLVLADEPFAALDQDTREDMQDLLLDVQRTTGMNVLLVTHSLDEALYLGDRIVVLDGGRIAADHSSPRNAGPRTREPDRRLAELIRATLQRKHS
ncbi:ATP-binding cassette domain-containing protein [Cellulomonas sp.]|uniref:ABC transporter ATP-binding protein n=1 Tax=Cellulomonas sp. TaxID=40001 RepID=UPI001AFE7F84|nr:ATP-binding cassette domain-containing protein [Cellulomonas sp.]MBO9553342.1 ATP-binding cassette domain-containing protein [Cellulomonas sp.]